MRMSSHISFSALKAMTSFLSLWTKMKAMMIANAKALRIEPVVQTCAITPSWMKSHCQALTIAIIAINPIILFRIYAICFSIIPFPGR